MSYQDKLKELNELGILCSGIAKWSLWGVPCMATHRGFHVEYSLEDDLSWTEWKAIHGGQLDALLDTLTVASEAFVIDKIEIQEGHMVLIHRRGGGTYVFTFNEPASESPGLEEYITPTDDPPRDDADELADKIEATVERHGIVMDECVVTAMNVDYGPDAPITQEVVGVILDSSIIPKDNLLHKLVKAREEDVKKGKITPTSFEGLDSNVPPFMRGKKQLP